MKEKANSSASGIYRSFSLSIYLIKMQKYLFAVALPTQMVGILFMKFRVVPYLIYITEIYMHGRVASLFLPFIFLCFS